MDSSHKTKMIACNPQHNLNLQTSHYSANVCLQLTTSKQIHQSIDATFVSSICVILPLHSPHTKSIPVSFVFLCLLLPHNLYFHTAANQSLSSYSSSTINCYLATFAP